RLSPLSAPANSGATVVMVSVSVGQVRCCSSIWGISGESRGDNLGVQYVTNTASWLVLSLLMSPHDTQCEVSVWVHSVCVSVCACVCVCVCLSVVWCCVCVCVYNRLGTSACGCSGAERLHPLQPVRRPHLDAPAAHGPQRPPERHAAHRGE